MNENIISIPFWEKYTLSIEESAAYFGIGENKLRILCHDNPNADWLLQIGNRTKIKRVPFENYINNINTI